MTNFDGTVDNRWRPDLASSQRRVREEEQEEKDDVIVVQSRELAFVPARRKAFQAHDDQTAAMIRRSIELERLRHGHVVKDLLEEWTWIDKMQTAEQKQRFLEPLIAKVRMDPIGNEDILTFLMVAFEPVRRGVGKEFARVQAGLSPQRDVSWGNRAEARMIHQIDRELMWDVTREGAIEAVFRYPSEGVQFFFPWLREVIAHRALDKLRGDLAQIGFDSFGLVEGERVQRAIAGFDDAEGPASRDRRGMREWRAKIHMRGLFEVVDEFFQHDAVAHAVRSAVGRLPRAERAVIEGHYFDETPVADLAVKRRVSPSTVYNQKNKAEKKLRADDPFFTALRALGQVRDAARAEQIRAAHPDGRLPDGRRIVLIDDKAA